jgi:hypothetical protein
MSSARAVTLFLALFRRRLHVSTDPNLFLLEDLEDSSRTGKLADSDLNALHAIADWIQGFVAGPHKDLGRDGAVCPFVPVALERKTLSLASEHIAGRSVADVVQLVNGYKTHCCTINPLMATALTTTQSSLFSPISRRTVQRASSTTS